MPYLIDGHNIIPKIPGLSLQDLDDEIQLIRLLQSFCRQHSKKVEVYFDNAPPGGPLKQQYGSVIAHFIRQDRTADTAIQSRLKRQGRSARNYIVITSDLALSIASKEAGARVISSEDFAGVLSIDESFEEFSPETNPDLTLNPDEINDWLKLFGKNDEEG